MSTKHTQGEWVVDSENNLIRASDDRHTVICSFHGSMRNPSVAADARLIAAAPELLGALVELVGYLDGDKFIQKYSGSMDLLCSVGDVRTALAAIAKATGVPK